MADDLPETLCPIYRCAFIKMQNSLTDATTAKEKIDILTKFSKKYLMIPSYWRLLMLLEQEQLVYKNRYSHKPIDDLIQEAQSHLSCSYTFCSHKDCREINIEWNDPLWDFHIQNADICIYRMQECLKFPHAYLEAIFKFCNSHGANPITKALKEEYQKSLKLYKKFMKAGDDVKKWLECIKGIDHEEAAIANFELLLGKGQNYANQKIWKYYFEFLKSKNSMDLLFVYQRYCRLFISDNHMRKEYWQAIEEAEKQGFNVLEHYFTAIEMEAECGNQNAAHFMLQKAALNNEIQIDFAFQGENSFPQKIASIKQKIEAKMRCKNELKTKKTFLRRQMIRNSRPHVYFSNSSKPAPQALTYPPTMIKMLLKNANADILHKLHKSCKYFFKHRPYPVCHRMVISNINIHNQRFIGQSIFRYDTSELNIAQDLYLCGSLTVKTTNRKLLSSLIQKLYKCEDLSFTIENQDLTVKELKFLINHGDAAQMKRLVNSCVLDDNGKKLTSEEQRTLFLKFRNSL